MKSVMVGLLAETSLHPGASGAEGDVDLPVAREEPLGFPLIPDSGVKGACREKRRNLSYQALRDKGEADKAAREKAEAEAERAFGKQDEAGPVSFGDARLLLLPVRSLDRLFRWVTCPYLIERLDRDIKRCGLEQAFEAFSTLSSPPDARHALVAADDAGGESAGQNAQAGGKTIFLEELDYELQPAPELESFVRAVKKLIGQSSVAARLKKDLAVVSDDIFQHIARTAPPVRTHNVLVDGKVSKNLFNEELLPVDTLLYFTATELRPGRLDVVTDLVPADAPYLRVGANETLGQGWCRAAVVGGSR